eukprot:scaffold786_cov329-Pavlova_lutheri.AAC.5
MLPEVALVNQDAVSFAFTAVAALSFVKLFDSLAERDPSECEVRGHVDTHTELHPSCLDREWACGWEIDREGRKPLRRSVRALAWTDVLCDYTDLRHFLVEGLTPFYAHHEHGMCGGWSGRFIGEKIRERSKAPVQQGQICCWIGCHVFVRIHLMHDIPGTVSALGILRTHHIPACQLKRGCCIWGCTGGIPSDHKVCGRQHLGANCFFFPRQAAAPAVTTAQAFTGVWENIWLVCFVPLVHGSPLPFSDPHPLGDSSPFHPDTPSGRKGERFPFEPEKFRFSQGRGAPPGNHLRRGTRRRDTTKRWRKKGTRSWDGANIGCMDVLIVGRIHSTTVRGRGERGADQGSTDRPSGTGPTLRVCRCAWTKHTCVNDVEPVLSLATVPAEPRSLSDRVETSGR